MSQQINLLPRERHALNPAIVALAVWGLVVCAVLGTWGVNQVRLLSAIEAEAASARQLKEAQAALEKRTNLRDAKGKGLNAEIDALRPRAAASEQLLNLAGGLGNPNGYASYFSTLAGIAEDGLWLTDVAVTQAGKAVKIGGRSLNKEAVMRYSQSLNTAFANQGVAFSSLDLTPETAGAGVPGAAPPPLAVMKFTLK